MTEHVWELIDAVQDNPGDDVIFLVWECTKPECEKRWGIYSSVTMPNWEAGECRERGT